MEYLTVKEVASKLKVTVRCVKNWVSRGDFPPPIRTSLTHALYDQDDIIKWANSKKIRENKKENYIIKAD